MIRNMSAELDNIKQAFEISLATQPKERLAAYRLRHQVYCVERGFEAGQDGIETDEYDISSSHVLLKHVATGQVIGTVRLVLLRGPHLGGRLPMEKVCFPPALRQIPRHHLAEVSRFALSKSLRMMLGAQSSLARLGLVRGIVELSYRLGVHHWCGLMEPKLLRLLQTSAIYFHQAGTMVEHHGMRQPSLLRLDQMLERVRREQPATWSYLTEDGRLLEEEQLEGVA